MIYTKLTKKALDISFKYHQNEFDKGGAPYVYHPFYVATKMDGEYEVCAALLHDIVEHKHMTVEELKNEFPAEVVEAVFLLTPVDGLEYLDYVDRLKDNVIARKVKIEDIKHNMMIERLETINENDFYRIEKYQKALSLLQTIK